MNLDLYITSRTNSIFRAERDRELQKKLRDHTAQMQVRRRGPKGTPQEEMEAARRELEIVRMQIRVTICCK